MGQALYRKYRSRSFGEVVGQEHVTKTLQNALKAGRLSHAYLFTGPRGVGKTSVARILAHEANGLEYKDDSIHLDIIEIDAASNRRIDEIRDLREKVNIAPAAAKYKVYIIDEVHMLTREAFNALLKTLEEPPAHCIFVLATTEAHKLPETIVSRTQRFEFRPVSPARAAGHLADIAKHEKIDIEPEALELLAEFGRGSFRDSISYLDQLASAGKTIKAADVRRVLGLPPSSQISRMLDIIGAGDIPELLSLLKNIEQKGVSPQAAAAALSENLRKAAQQDGLEQWQIKLLAGLLNVSASERAQETLEIILLDAAAQFGRQPAQTPKAGQKSSEKNAQPKEVSPGKARPATKKSFEISMWQDVTARCKDEAASVYTALRLASPAYENGTLTLSFQFPLHQKKLEQAKNKQLVSAIIERLCGEKVQIISVVNKNQLPQPPAADEQPGESPANIINNIFGNTEVTEA